MKLPKVKLNKRSQKILTIIVIMGILLFFALVFSMIALEIKVVEF